jgi:DNA-binding CsgD family transcriptional regulator
MTPEELARALAQNGPGSQSALDALDDRELEVFSILSHGYSTGQMQSEFGIAAPELKRLKRAIQKKLGYRTEAQLLQAASRYVSGGGL